MDWGQSSREKNINTRCLGRIHTWSNVGGNQWTSGRNRCLSVFKEFIYMVLREITENPQSYGRSLHQRASHTHRIQEKVLLGTSVHLPNSQKLPVCLLSLGSGNALNTDLQPLLSPAKTRSWGPSALPWQGPELGTSVLPDLTRNRLYTPISGSQCVQRCGSGGQSTDCSFRAHRYGSCGP